MECCSDIRRQNTSRRRYQRFCCRLTALCVWLACVVLCPGDTPADQLTQQAVQLLQTGKAQEAIVELNKVVAQSPEYFPAYSLLGVSYTQLGQLEQATGFFEKAVELAPQSTQARNNLAANYLALGKYAEAVTQCKTVLAADPNSLTALVNLAHSEMGLGNPRAALQSLEEAQKQAPQDIEVQLALAEARFKNGQGETAVDQIKALTNGPQGRDPRLLVAVGLLLQRHGHAAEAAPLLRRAVDSGPENAQNILALAQRSMDEGDYRSALVLSTALESAYSDSASWHEMVGYAHFKLDQPEPAISHLQQAIRLDPANEDYYLTLGEFLGANNALPALVAVFESAVQAMPNSVKMQSALGVTYIMVRDFEKAKAVLSALTKAHPGYSMGYKLLADCYHREKDWAGLKDVAAKLRQINENSALGWYFAAEADYWQSTAQGAESFDLVHQYVDKAIELDAENWRSRALLGKVLLQEGRLPEAVVAFQTAISLKDAEPSVHYLLATTLRKLGREAESKQAFAAFEKAQENEKLHEFRQLLVNVQ